MKTEYEDKTSTQLKIESSVTNARSYQRVPYAKLFGQKLALKQWLVFSGLRCINLYNCSSDKTPLMSYLPLFFEYSAKEKINEAIFIMYNLGKIKGLERRVNKINLESV